MTKYILNRKQLKEYVNAVLSEAIYDSGVEGLTLSSDYDNDMKNLANKTGETMDDDFLDSVAHYDNINNGPDGPVYPDRKKEEMTSDWRNFDDQVADTQAQYGKDADALDRLQAFTDTIDQYVNDTNLNGYEDNSGYMAMKDYDNARAEAEHPVESIIRKAVREALDPYNHPEDSNGNQFASNYGVEAHNFTHNGVDSYWARKDQDKMHKNEKSKMKRADKRAMAAADKRPLHRKGSLNRAFESKTRVNEGNGRYVFHCYRQGLGNDTMLIGDLNEIKDYIKDAKYWDVSKGDNSTDPNNLIAWGGEGGYWYNVLNKPQWAKEGVHWDKPSERIRQLILSKRKDIKQDNTFESKVRKAVREAITEITDDDAFWKQQHEDEMNYEMGEFAKAMQKANGTYKAKSRDGKWQTGDKVIVHGRSKNVEGIITDFDENFMTYEETCDVDFEEDGKTKTLINVPLSRIEKVSTNESKGRKINEEWYPEEDDDLSDYSYGAIMKLDVAGVFDELTPEKVQEISSIKDEYAEHSNKYTSVMIRKVNLTPDGFDGYDVSVEVAVSAPDMPIDEIENDTQEIVWLWIEEKLGVRSPNVQITDEKVVFDRRTKNANN